MNYFCSPTVCNIPELPEHIQRACETPIRSWTTDLEESLIGRSTMERLRLGLIHHGRSMVILENAFAGVTSFYSKYALLTASFNEKMKELEKARGETEAVRVGLHRKEEELQQARDELKKFHDEQTAKDAELRRLRSENEVYAREQVLLAQ